MYDYVWPYKTKYDNVWLCMTMYDYVWLCKTMHDYVWLCMTIFGYVWQYMTMYDCIWIRCSYWPMPGPDNPWDNFGASLGHSGAVRATSGQYEYKLVYFGTTFCFTDISAP